MKRLLMFVVLLSLSAGTAGAQWGNGRLAIRADAQSECGYVYPPVGQVLPLYVVHSNHAGARGVRFAAPKPDCFNAIWLWDTTSFVEIAVGNSQTGITVGYGACLPAPVVVLAMNFLVLGSSTPCCAYFPRADPMDLSGHIVAVDCDDQSIWINGFPALINPTTSCFDPPCHPIEPPVPAEETTWGQVKALFGD